MGEQYVGEIRMFGGNFAPIGWALCNGQLLPIADNEVLFTLIGTTYGGDGQTNFAVPDLRGRVPVHQGQGNGLSAYTLGQVGGVESVTLTLDQLPSHTHLPNASSTNAGATTVPTAQIWAASSTNVFTTDTSATVPMHPQATLPAGGPPIAHDNMMPFSTVSFIIATEGIYPSQS